MAAAWAILRLARNFGIAATTEAAEPALQLEMIKT